MTTLVSLSPPGIERRPLFHFSSATPLTPTAGDAMPAGPQIVAAPRFSDYPEALGHSFTKGLFSRDHIKPLLIGTAATLAVLPFADEISNRIRGKWTALGNAGDAIGSPITMAALTGGVLVATPFTDNQKYKAFAFTLSQAMIVDTALVQGLKFAISRSRPSAENESSFPSGHTAHTMTVATVAHHFYGNKLGIPLYLLSGFVGLSRVEKGKHFLGDVIFGATVGYISAQAAIKASRHYTSKRRLTFLPEIGLQQVGGRVLVEF